LDYKPIQRYHKLLIKDTYYIQKLHFLPQKHKYLPIRIKKEFLSNQKVTLSKQHFLLNNIELYLNHQRGIVYEREVY